MKKKNITLLQELRAALVTKGDYFPEGEGWKTAEQYAEEDNVSRARSYVLLEQGVKSGIVEVQWAKTNRHKKKVYRKKI
jgi:hypothetical protein